MILRSSLFITHFIFCLISCKCILFSERHIGPLQTHILSILYPWSEEIDAIQFGVWSVD